MSKTTIRIATKNNSDARALRLDVAKFADLRHNGGKTVIATLDAEDLSAARECLEADHKVASFEVA